MYQIEMSVSEWLEVNDNPIQRDGDPVSIPPMTLDYVRRRYEEEDGRMYNHAFEWLMDELEATQKALRTNERTLGAAVRSAAHRCAEIAKTCKFGICAHDAIRAEFLKYDIKTKD